VPRGFDQGVQSHLDFLQISISSKGPSTLLRNTGRTGSLANGKISPFAGIGVRGGNPGEIWPLDVLTELLKVNWKETGIQLAGYAAFRARNLAWRTGSSDLLAKGLMPDDIAAQAILSVISGERTWEPERGPLLPYLKRIVDSLLSHLAESGDNRWLDPWTSEDTQLAAGTALPEADSDCRDETDDDQDDRIEQLFDAVADKPELAEVLDAMLKFDETRPRYLALRIGKPVSHVNNCLKRIRRLALKIVASRICQGVSGEETIDASPRRGALMKRVEAIIKPSKLATVRDALAQIGVGEIAVEPASSKVKIGVIVSDENAPQVVSTIELAVRR
jgi:DNA-directed RNA polymerase specialized sigma24 family protein